MSNKLQAIRLGFAAARRASYYRQWRDPASFKIKSKRRDKSQANQVGGILILAIVFTSIFTMLAMGVLTLVMSKRQLSLQKVAQNKSLQIAEAGVNYYRWHLAHAETDYTDGNASSTCNPCGPYTHNFSDPYGGMIGKFQLTITPPPERSSVVTIKSVGWLDDYPKQTKTIVVRYSIPSLATFSFLSNNDVWFGTNEEVVGPMHSNGGVRMDGTNDSTVTSAKETYICTPSHGCANETKPGVWGAGPNSDMWEFPIPTVNFNLLSTSFNKLKTAATTTGIYYGPSSKKGYHIVFKSNGTFDVYTVTQLESTVKQQNDNWNGWENIAEQIKREDFLANRSAPSNGVIFIEDNVWTEGTVKGRFTLASAVFPENPATYTNIVINNNINYLARTASNTLALMAQKHVKVPRYAPSTLNIDAIMLAQKGRVFRNLYYSPSVKTSITVYGGIITSNVWTWTWVNGSNVTIDGYNLTRSIYDNNMAYSPPPSFPTTGIPDFISWEELLPGETFN